MMDEFHIRGVPLAEGNLLLVAGRPGDPLELLTRAVADALRSRPELMLAEVAPPTEVRFERQASLVTLTWRASQSSEVIKYVIRRDGAPIGTTTATTFLDPYLGARSLNYDVMAEAGDGRQ